MANVNDLKMTEFKNRYKGDMPKVGIRPIIDRRRNEGRAKLENECMVMAKRAAELITKNLRHSNGLPVECVISDFCIGSAAESAQAEEIFEKSGVGASLSVTPVWCNPTETMDMDPIRPKAIWGYNYSQQPGAVYLAALNAAHNQKGLPIFSIYGHDVQDVGGPEITPDVQEKILRFVKAAISVATVRRKSCLSMGSVSIGISGSIVNEHFFQEYLGMRSEMMDATEIIRRMEKGIYNKEEFARALKWVKENCKEGTDFNPKEKQSSREQKDKDWEFVIKMYLISRDLMVGNPKLAEMGFAEEAVGHNAILGGFQGQRQWTDFYPNGDFLESILNSSFDWNGIREPYVFATENDNLNGVSMLFGHLISNTAQAFEDVRTYWSPEAVKRVTGKELTGVAKNGLIHFLNSGPVPLDLTGMQEKNGKPVMKPFWEITPEEVGKCLDATVWSPASTTYFNGGGYSSTIISRGGMPLTMSRVNLVRGLGPVMQIAEGYSVDLPEDINKTLIARSAATWPTTWFAPTVTGKGAFKDVYSVMANWGANHAAVSYGHIGADLITLASMLRIPVNMHNVPEEKIFRPVVWASFGTEQSEAADFRTCDKLGPLYGTRSVF